MQDASRGSQLTMVEFKLFCRSTIAPPPVMFHEWDELDMRGDTGDVRYWLDHSGAMCAHMMYGKWWIWRDKDGLYNGGLRRGRNDEAAPVGQIVAGWPMPHVLEIATLYSAQLSDG